MNTKRIFGALLTIIGTGGLFVIYCILGIIFFIAGIGLMFNAED